MEDIYSVPGDIIGKLKEGEIAALLAAFKQLDTDASGKVSKSELLKLSLNDAESESLTSMMDKIDLNGDGELSFGEFLTLLIAPKFGIDTTVTTEKKNFVEKVSGSYKHTYAVEERECFARVINQGLEKDEDVKSLLPIDPDTDALFAAIDNGIILCKLVNVAQPGTIDERVINIGGDLNVFKISENLNLALAIKSIGLKVIGVDAELIRKRTESLILGLLWQLIRIILMKDINLKHVPELARLVYEDKDEELADLLRLPVEEIFS